MSDTPFIPTPIPSLSSSSTPSRPSLTSRLSVVIPDDRGITSLIARLIDQSGLHQVELANRMGVCRQSVNQYRIGRRSNPSIQWLARLVNVCGGRLLIEFPHAGKEL